MMHRMWIRQSRTKPRYYWSQCTQCDSYSSKYWDKSDCPTEHTAEEYSL